MRFLYFIAGLMMAHQVIGKTARDALFLIYFGKDDLPTIKIAAAVVAILFGLTVPRLFQRYGTARAVPCAFVFSGFLHFLEFALRDVSPKSASILVYLHVVALSAILLSSFWLLLAERFDPGEARLWFGRIAGYGTVGGIAGGLLAMAWPSSGQSGLSLIFLMGTLHIVCGIGILIQSQRAPGEPHSISSPFLSPRKALSSVPYLRIIALLVFLGTTSAALLDIRFLSAARDSAASDADLVRFIAIFQTSTQIACFVLQAFLVRFALNNYSIGTNIGTLPATVFLGSAGSFFFPGLAAITLGRGAEYVVRGSLYRSGYEVFYSPVPPSEKRAAKSFIDVVCDRMGDAAGGLITRFAVAPGDASISAVIPGIAGAIALFNVFLSLRLDRSYAHVVHRGLTDRAQQINEHLSRFGDWSLDTVLLESLPPNQSSTSGSPAAVGSWAIPTPQLDETTRSLAVLRSGDPIRVRHTLALLDPPDPALVPCLIELLGWSEVWKDARAALIRGGRRHVGQFVDSLADPATDFSIRRRLPSVLAACGGARAAGGLAEALSDDRFEIRLQCARALDVLVSGEPAMCPPQQQVRAAIERELSVSPQLWKSGAVIDDQAAPPVAGAAAFRDSAGTPTDYRLELLFSLLALIHDREPLKAAFRALHSSDKLICALGFEYVDSLLPSELRDKFHTLAAEGLQDRAPHPQRSSAEVASILLASQRADGPFKDHPK